MIDILNSMQERPPAAATAQDQILNPAASPLPSDSIIEHNLESARAEIKRLRAENVRLQEQLFAEMDATLAAGGDASMPADEAKLKSALIRSQRDVVGFLQYWHSEFNFINISYNIIAMIH